MEHLRIARIWASDLLDAFYSYGLDPRQMGFDARTTRALEHAPAPSIEEIRSLWHSATRLAASPILGVEIARRLTPRASGLLLPIMLHSPTGLQALRHLANYQVLVSDSGQFEITQDPARDAWDCEYRPTPAAVPVSLHQVLSVVTVTLDTLRLVTGRRLRVQHLWVPPTLDAKRIGRVLYCPCDNRDGHFCLCLDRKALEVPIHGRDEHLYAINLSYAEGLLRARRQRQGFIDAVKAGIDTRNPVSVDIATVARAMNQQPRTLQRNLCDQATNFRQLKASVLKTRALDYLIARKYSPQQIADALGYNDLSTFYRAFRSWYGVTPLQFRNRATA